MPVLKAGNGRWKVGTHGRAVYKTKQSADRAYHGYLARRHARRPREAGQ